MTSQAIVDLQPHISDPDPSLREMFMSEAHSRRSSLDSLVLTLLPSLLLPTLPTSELPVLMSLNAGIGGAEAAHFCEELVRMYTRFAEKRGWKAEIITQVEGSTPGKGGSGLKELTIRFEPGTNHYGAEGDKDQQEGDGREVFGLLKWERGVHRVQRVPINENQGRIHTSTAAVVVGGPRVTSRSRG